MITAIITIWCQSLTNSTNGQSFVKISTNSFLFDIFLVIPTTNLSRSKPMIDPFVKILSCQSFVPYGSVNHNTFS